MALRNIAAACLGLALIAAPAFAQTATVVDSPSDLNDAQMDEAYCVYDGMGADAKNGEVIAKALLTDDKDAAVKSREIHAAARAACVAKYKWSVEQADVAGTVATAAVLSDLMEHQLRARGLDDKKLEALTNVADALSDADFDAVMRMGSDKPDDAAMTRVRKQITDAGVPTDRDTVEIALVFLHGSMTEYEGMLDWVDSKFY